MGFAPPAPPAPVEDMDDVDGHIVTGGWVPSVEPVAHAAEETRQPRGFGLAGLLDRVALRPGAAVGLIVVSVVAILIAAAIAWHARAHPVIAVAPPAIGASGGAGPASRASPGVVVVDVAGKVRRPGLVTLPIGSRVADALRAAGGARPGTDLTGVNLARKLIDGEQIVVGAPAAVAAPTSGAAGGPATTGGVVDLNTATTGDFDSLPGIGPVLAQRIIDWRTAHGGFTDVTQLRQVSGIGDSKYAQLKALVRV
jgi:competence protein ComEA